MIAKNWMREAAEEIAILMRDRKAALPAGLIAQVIERHCPFKPDAAYEEVKVRP